MKVCVASPYPLSDLKGNSVTTKRTVDLLVAEGIEARASHGFDGEDADVLIALHAVKGAGAVRDFRKACPEGRIIVLITGTDLYQYLPAGSEEGRETLRAADAIVVVGDILVKSLPEEFRAKAVVVPKSLDEISIKWAPSEKLIISVVGHLRPVKRPFLTIEAVAENPDWPVEVWQIGESLTDDYSTEAERWQKVDPRYRWLGGVPREEALQLCSQSSLTINSSELEGGPNAILEAMMMGVPVLVSDIEGNRLLLDDDYSGYFQEGELEERLGEIIRGEIDPAKWVNAASARAALFSKEREVTCWLELLGEFTKDRPTP